MPGETILTAYMHTHTHTHTGTRTHEYTDYTKLYLHTTYTNNRDLRLRQIAAQSGKMAGLSFWKKKCLEA